MLHDNVMIITHCVSLSVRCINGVFNWVKVYYPHVFLEESKYVVMKIRWPSLMINDELEIYTDGYDYDKER